MGEQLLTQEGPRLILVFTGSTDCTSDYDVNLMNIITEQAGAYFAGDRSLDDTVAAIQSRVGLYLAELQLGPRLILVFTGSTDCQRRSIELKAASHAPALVRPAYENWFSSYQNDSMRIPYYPATQEEIDQLMALYNAAEGTSDYPFQDLTAESLEG